MNYELFIAKRIISGKAYKNSISSPIIKIAITAITLGMIVMLISVATSGGLQHKIREKISGFKGHIQITNYDNNNSEITLDPIALEQDFYPSFTTIPEVESVYPYTTIGGIIRTKTDFEGVLFKGVAKDYNWDFFEEYLVEGRLPDFTQKRNKDILISKFIADRLGLKLNDEIQIVFSTQNTKNKYKIRKPKIVGIYNSGFQQFDKSVILGDIDEAQKLYGWNAKQVGGFEIHINNINKLTEVNNKVYKTIPSNLNSQSILGLYPKVFEWINLFDNNTAVILAIMILVAGINMITALLVLILERVQMVGILKALGSSDWSIRKIFMYNATYLILKGLFWGNLIGLLILFVQDYFKLIALDPETYYVATVPVYISFWQILVLNLGTLILCFLMLILPSIIVAKIRPSESIKFA